MTRSTRRTAVAAIATALVSLGGLPAAQALESQRSPAPDRVAPQADERRWECVRENKISGMSVRSLLCLRVIWDESAGTTTLVARLRVINGSRSTHSIRIHMATHRGVVKDSDIHDHGLAPGSSVTYTKTRRVPRYLDHPLAKSQVVLYSGASDDYTVRGKTLRAAP